MVSQQSNVALEATTMVGLVPIRHLLVQLTALLMQHELIRVFLNNHMLENILTVLSLS